MQSGIHPDWTIEDYEGWLRLAKEVAPGIHLHAYSPMEVHYMAGNLPLDEVFARLLDVAEHHGRGRAQPRPVGGLDDLHPAIDRQLVR